MSFNTAKINDMIGKIREKIAGVTDESIPVYVHCELERDDWEDITALVQVRGAGGRLLFELDFTVNNGDEGCFDLRYIPLTIIGTTLGIVTWK